MFARFYGHNNLPDSSNMCHETTSVGLKKVIGSPVGTCVLEDFDHCDAIFYFGQNPGSNSPRFLHNLQDAARRGCKIVTFNPVRETGLIRFINPQNPLEMLTGQATELSHLYLQVRPGGDIAALMGLCKHVVGGRRLSQARGRDGVIDRDFLGSITPRVRKAFIDVARAADWDADRTRFRPRSRRSDGGRRCLYRRRTRHRRLRHGPDPACAWDAKHRHAGQPASAERQYRPPGRRDLAGARPFQRAGPAHRGHFRKARTRCRSTSSRNLFDFEPPREKGLTTVDVCEGVLDGSVRAFIGLGGNFVRAAPEREAVEQAWRNLDLTVQISTKLNRSHLMHGRAAFILPCLARSEQDQQASGPQSVSIEDSFSHIHGSIGRRAPASEELRSELAIVAGLAKATLPEHP